MKLRHWRNIIVGLLAAAVLTSAENHYETLGVKSSATNAEIKRAYYKLARTLHPDKVTDQSLRADAEKKFKRVAEAHSTLSDAAKRKEYDEELRRPPPTQRGAPPLQRQQQGQRQRPPQQQQRQQQPAAQPFDPNSHEAKARKQVRTIRTLLQISDVLDKHKRLDRHLLVAMHDSRDQRCQRALESMKFPYPFADWSQDWHGVWWGDLLLPVAHDVGPSLQAGRPSEILSTFEGAVGPAKRSTHGVAMPQCPTLILQKRGYEPGEQGGWSRMPTSAPGELSPEGFTTWVWSHLEVPLTIRSEHTKQVRVNWIHGQHVKEMLTLRPRESTERVVFLGHTLHAELADRKGHTISEGSSLLIFKVVNNSAMVIKPKACLDKTSDCEDWFRKGECGANPSFMMEECPVSCQLCDKLHPRRPAVKPKASNAAAAAAKANDASCADEYKDCGIWAATGECDNNKQYMEEHCKRSCGLCGGCSDSHEGCASWAKNGQCTANAEYMASTCPKACGICGKSKGAAADEKCEDNYGEKCRDWAKNGQCTANAAFMETNCKRSCALCTCKDLLPGAQECPAWKQDQMCVRNRRFMAKHCKKSCGWCSSADPDTAGKDACADEDIKCEDWGKKGECNKNVAFMKEECPRSCRACKPSAKRADTSKRPPAAPPPPLKPATPPPKGSGGTAKPAAAAAAPPCEDHDQRCTAWAEIGQCTGSNGAMMLKTCPKACNACGKAAAAEAIRAHIACVDERPDDCPWMSRAPDACKQTFMQQNCRKTCNLCGAGGVRVSVDARGGNKEEL